jgi:hypothetical protein
MRRWENPEAALDVETRQGGLDVSLAARRHRREGDYVGAVLDEAAERAEDVVANACPRQGQRRDVERDPHARGV